MPATVVVDDLGFFCHGGDLLFECVASACQVVDACLVVRSPAAKYAAQFMLNPPRPPHWGGYRLVPDEWQFWQGRKSRLHDRLRYRLNEGEWLRERLAP